MAASGDRGSASSTFASPEIPFPMPTEAEIVTEGTIIAVLPGTMFRVELNERHVVLAHISGKMRKRFIRLNRGDRVQLELSPYDLKGAHRLPVKVGQSPTSAVAARLVHGLALPCLAAVRSPLLGI
jgi:translation initiation factor IF-1